MNKNIQFVDREEVSTTRKRKSKFAPLLDALDKIEPGGKAVEVEYKSDKQLSSMRTAVYQYNKRNNVKVRSAKDSRNGKIYFYRNK